jgi:hypothetical protein
MALRPQAHRLLVSLVTGGSKLFRVVRLICLGAGQDLVAMNGQGAKRSKAI